MKKVFFYSLIFIVACLICIYFYFQPKIIFVDQEIHLALYQEVNPLQYIQKVSHIEIDDIQVDNQVDNGKLGQYQIHYSYQQKTYSLTVYIDDMLAPQFEVQNKTILKDETVKPEELVKNIQDDSDTKVYFVKEYIFDEEKTYQVGVVVEDSYGNKTKKNAYIQVQNQDKQPPTVTGLTPITLLIGDEIDLKKDVVVKDDHDEAPLLTIDDSKLNIRQMGEYKVYYHVKDASGNEDTLIRKVEVLSQYDNREALKDGIKTCYLTFDDGPSSNTKEILDILDEYHIKATFFVTGTSPKDFHYIKEAYQKGHTIGLHTYSHDYEYIYSSLKNYISDLNKIKDVVYQQIGKNVDLIRFPGGSSNLVSKKYNEGIMTRLTKKVIDLGYQYYDWTSINGDGEGIKTVDGLIKKAKEEIGEQEDIMFLMHDSGTQENTVKALPAILDYLIEQGYVFQILDETSPTFHHHVQN